MSKKRMAGDKLQDMTPNEHQATGMSNYNNADYATKNKYGKDLSGISYKEGIDEHFGGDGSIGENDIKRMMDAGYSSDDVYNFSKKKGLNYNQHGQKYMKSQGDYQIGKGSDQWGDVFGSTDKKESTESTQTASKFSDSGGGSNSATNSSTINGDNNNVDQSITQNINNSRNYGGSNRSFTYNGGKNSATDTPVSMATMAGYYAPDDSPSANAARVDRQVQQNTDIQKQLRESAPPSYIDPEKMDNRIQQREAYSRAKAKTMAGNIFGDMFSMKTPEWNSAKPAKEVESPDFESMYNKYTKF